MDVRQGRIKAPGDPDYAIYHCMNRIVDRRFVLGDTEKSILLKYLKEYEKFCGISVITFKLLDNHFHLVLEVPKRPETPLSDEELLERVESLSGSGGSKQTRQQLTWFRERGQHDAAETLRQRFLRRMWDVSQFMKTLEQRFSQWFNRNHHRRGVLWESRFKSTLVESKGLVFAAMAAYVDLNGVRAGLADDPMKCPWCGYRHALAGDKSLQEGVRKVVAAAQGVAPESLTHRQALREYRQMLFVAGEETEGTDAQGRRLRKGFKPEQVLEVIRRKGSVPIADYLRLRVRYFVDGLAMGSKEFVEKVFQAYRSHFGPRRKTGARRMQGVAEELYVLRDLKRDLFSCMQPPVQEAAGTTGAGPP